MLEQQALRLPVGRCLDEPVAGALLVGTEHDEAFVADVEPGQAEQLVGAREVLPIGERNLGCVEERACLQIPAETVCQPEGAPVLQPKRQLREARLAASAAEAFAQRNLHGRHVRVVRHAAAAAVEVIAQARRVGEVDAGRGLLAVAQLLVGHVFVEWRVVAITAFGVDNREVGAVLLRQQLVVGGVQAYLHPPHRTDGVVNPNHLLLHQRLEVLLQKQCGERVGDGRVAVVALPVVVDGAGRQPDRLAGAGPHQVEASVGLLLLGAVGQRQAGLQLAVGKGAHYGGRLPHHEARDRVEEDEARRHDARVAQHQAVGNGDVGVADGYGGEAAQAARLPVGAGAVGGLALESAALVGRQRHGAHLAPLRAVELGLVVVVEQIFAESVDFEKRVERVAQPVAPVGDADAAAHLTFRDVVLRQYLVEAARVVVHPLLPARHQRAQRVGR